MEFKVYFAARIFCFFQNEKNCCFFCREEVSDVLADNEQETNVLAAGGAQPSEVDTINRRKNPEDRWDFGAVMYWL